MSDTVDKPPVTIKGPPREGKSLVISTYISENLSSEGALGPAKTTWFHFICSSEQERKVRLAVEQHKATALQFIGFRMRITNYLRDLESGNDQLYVSIQSDFSGKELKLKLMETGWDSRLEKIETFSEIIGSEIHWLDIWYKIISFYRYNNPRFLRTLFREKISYPVTHEALQLSQFAISDDELKKLNEQIKERRKRDKIARRNKAK
jgi:hypothetical protein